MDKTTRHLAKLVASALDSPPVEFTLKPCGISEIIAYFTGTPPATGEQSHELRCWPEQFRAMKRGLKWFEYRKLDRNFQDGDCLVLKEWNQHKSEYTGEQLYRRIVYILKDAPEFGLPPGYAVIGLSL